MGSGSFAQERYRVVHYANDNNASPMTRIYPQRETTGDKQRWWKVEFEDSTFKWYKVLANERTVVEGAGP